MAQYNFLAQQPEAPITEKWVWPSDVILSDDGSEQRISLSIVPRRSWSGEFSFSASEDLRRHVATMFTKFKGAFNWPAWHWLVKAKQSISTGATIIYCNTSRSDFREGMLAFISEGNTRELITVIDVEVDHITVAPVVNNYSARALICPVYLVYSSDGPRITRTAPNNGGTASYTFPEYTAVYPFIEDDNLATLTTFSSYPVLDRKPTGTSFEQTVLTGATVTDYNAQVSIRARWKNSQFTFPVSFISHRTFDPTDWNWWRTFADYCKGSVKPFYFSTGRDDLIPNATMTGGATQVDLINTEYGDHYWPVTTFRKVAFNRADGVVHYATVTARTVASNRDRLTFTPALPAGNWTDATISFLLLCRINDDTVSTEHDGTQSLVTLNLRTTDG